MDKTIVFDNGSESNGMMGLIASLCQKQGIDPGYVMAMMNNRGGNGMQDGGWSWIWVIFLFFLMGWGRNGYGGFGGGNGQGEGNFLAGQLDNTAGRELLQQAINGNGQAISQLASTLNCDINAVQGSLNQLNQAVCNVGNQVGLSSQSIINAVNSGNATIASSLCDCCCTIQRQIADFRGDIALQMCQQTNALTNSINNVAVGQERGFSSVAYETQKQTCDITKAIADSTSQILAGQRAAEMREMQRDLQQLRDERTQYQMSALLQQQSRNIIDTVRPCPTPAFITCNPWGCNGGFYGNGYPYNNGGCCGNNNGCCNG